VSRMHGLALAVRDANKNSGAQVVPLTRSGADHFLWYDDYRFGMIKSKLNDLCLQAEGNIHRVSKNCGKLLFRNFVKFPTTAKIFGTKTARAISLYEMHSVFTSTNFMTLCHRTNVLNADVPNC